MGLVPWNYFNYFLIYGYTLRLYKHGLQALFQYWKPISQLHDHFSPCTLTDNQPVLVVIIHLCLKNIGFFNLLTSLTRL